VELSGVTDAEKLHQAVVTTRAIVRTWRIGTKERWSRDHQRNSWTSDMSTRQMQEDLDAVMAWLSLAEEV